MRGGYSGSDTINTMNITRRRGSTAFFITLGICLVGLAVALNVGWIIVNVNERRIVQLVLGIIFFAVIIAGLVLNTIFLVREIRRNERQDSFLNAVTHELKTPIASIRLYLDTLQRRPLEESQRQEFYTRMREDKDRLLATVEQILRAGEAGAKSVVKNLKARLPVDMRALTAECLHETVRRHHLQTDAVAMDDQTRGADVFVNADRDSLRTAVLNVLDNAVKYSPAGVHITAELTSLQRGLVLLRIIDTGVGIPQAQLKRIFHRFYRVGGTNTAKVKGTGLGLFIVRAIARQHGGDATAQSYGEGRGTTITLQLPLMTPGSYQKENAAV
jgi:two-component system sensor histidine kinase SenX3